MSSPELSSPEMSSPELSSPELSSPELSSPESSSPELSSPELSSFKSRARVSPHSLENCHQRLSTNPGRIKKKSAGNDNDKFVSS